MTTAKESKVGSVLAADFARLSRTLVGYAMHEDYLGPAPLCTAADTPLAASSVNVYEGFVNGVPPPPVACVPVQFVYTFPEEVIYAVPWSDVLLNSWGVSTPVNALF